jgi:6-phosphogluconolactonase/glucosamine-6-phosphate isomerase/deaminase
MGIGTLLSAEAIALVVSGPGKDSALARVLEGPTDHDVPATFLRAHPSLAVFTCD